MAERRSSIYFNSQYSFTFSNRKKIRSSILALFLAENVMLDSLSYIFCSDDFLHQLNITYLSHDTLTDVITFTLSDTGLPVIGEIYISIDRIKENAKLFNTSTHLELLRIMFHGALHLCGYNDKSIKDKKLMTQQENYYLAFYH